MIVAGQRLPILIATSPLRAVNGRHGVVFFH